MTTTVTFYTEPTNLDYLMGDVRIRYGDLTGSIYSDTIVRTSLVSAIRYLQRALNGKYQVYKAADQLNPQPADVPTGYVRINSLHGVANIPNTTVEGSMFRDPYAIFSHEAPPILESIDEEAVVLAAKYILRSAQISSSAADFVAWGTEDIRYNNLGSERGMGRLLEQDLNELNTYIRSKIAKPRLSTFPITYIPTLTYLY